MPDWEGKSNQVHGGGHTGTARKCRKVSAVLQLFAKPSKISTLFLIVLIAVMATSILILHVFSGSYMAPVLMLLVVVGLFVSSREIEFHTDADDSQAN